MKYRWDVINRIIQNRGYKRYLEIGVKDGLCFHQIKCSVKAGMDIKPLIINERVLRMSSDEYFNSPYGREIYEIIFIDGDHREAQVDRDIRNSIRILAPHGIIVMHDCNPPKEEYANEERQEKQILWSGTAYRSFLKLRNSDPNLEMFVVDIDWGCGIIQRGKQELLNISINYNWADFDNNRVAWLNLISVEEFQRRFQ
ncbi:MAG: hypothetical protein AMJ79_12795 [Phycisphaerae bacterium SM23_30]|nr:MAG: hypothetical protein AMJ79_12795 [Phycisphaerae bacterium SM23_30]